LNNVKKRIGARFLKARAVGQGDDGLRKKVSPGKLVMP
jgi:hypothetical protein